MRVVLIFCFITLFYSNSGYAQTFDRSWSFTQLFGAEDTAQNTHLFFRVNEKRDYYCTDQYSSGPRSSTIGDFRHLDLATQSDSTFHFAYGMTIMDCSSNNGSISIEDFHPFDNNFDHYLFVGAYGDGFEPYGYSQVGSQDYYLAPLFDGFHNVEANPYLGNYFFLPRYGNLTVRVPITQNQDTLDYINYYWHEIYYSDEVDSTILKTYDFTLLALSPFADSLAIISKEGRTFRTEDFNKSVDTLDIQFYLNSNVHFDLDSTHIYAISDGMNLLISDNYGHAKSWKEKEVQFDPLTLQVDPANEGHIYGSFGNSLFKSEDFGNQFTIFQSFDFEIVDYYVKPSGEKIYVLSKENIYEYTSGGLQSVRSIPSKDTIRIELENLPYKAGNEFVFTIRKRIEVSENLSKWVPIDEFHNSITVDDNTITFNNQARHPFLDQITISEQNQLLTDSFYFDGEWVLLTDSLLQYSTWRSHQKEDSLFNLAAYGDPHYSYYNREIVDKGTIINYFQSQDSTSKYGTNISTAYWSPTLGFTRFFIYDQEHLYISLKGAIIDGVQYGDMEVIKYVTTEKEPVTPSSITLHQNYPNPFNPSTVISYSIPKGSAVILRVFDQLGREVQTLENTYKQAGTHTVTFDASSLSSGVYFYVLEAKDLNERITQKMMLIK